MKKFLLSLMFAALIGSGNQLAAQCSGAVIISNFAVLAPGNTVQYSFDWEYVQGNASIQVVDSCNGVFEAASACIPRIKDSAAGVHHVEGTLPTNCAGVLKVSILIWTNPDCGGTSCVARSIEILHIPLPVQFNAFTATRSQSNVALKWATIWEQNSAGFAVERNTNGTWQQVAYVPTQAPNGNSSDLLNYQHIDANNNKGISQYRIKQVDLDGKSKYSEIRTVRGESQVGQVIVFPNPSYDGKVNVSFEDAATRDISVLDMSGRMIRQIKGVSTNSITMENLAPGMYTMRIFIPATGEQVVAKIVVNKR
jgi:hypothetical protein